MIARKQQWNRDTEIEKMASEFLDQNFYTIFEGKADVQRYGDTYYQFGGIDLRINNTNFDEKCKVWGCLNTVQQNVGFECSLKNKAGYVQDGWLLASNISTDFYAIIGLSTTVDQISDLTSTSQIYAADVLWVKKSDLTSFIDIHTPISQIKSDAIELRETSNKTEKDEDGIYSNAPACLGWGPTKDGKYRTKYDHEKFWLTYSSRKHEQPLNLVVPRQTLESFPHSRHFIVQEGKVKKA